VGRSDDRTGDLSCGKAGQAGFDEEEDAWSVSREMEALVVRVWGRESEQVPTPS
jgi:hypothetical protein